MWLVLKLEIGIITLRVPQHFSGKKVSFYLVSVKFFTDIFVISTMYTNFYHTKTLRLNDVNDTISCFI